MIERGKMRPISKTFEEKIQIKLEPKVTHKPLSNAKYDCHKKILENDIRTLLKWAYDNQRKVKV